jgi:hypothetical protein
MEKQYPKMKSIFDIIEENKDICVQFKWQKEEKTLNFTKEEIVHEGELCIYKEQKEEMKSHKYALTHQGLVKFNVFLQTYS